VPEAAPYAVGTKITLTVQLELTGKTEPQLLLCAKGPLAEIDESGTGPTLVLVNVTFIAPLEPTGCKLKLSAGAESVKPGLVMVTDNWAECDSEPEVPVMLTGNVPPTNDAGLLIVRVETAPLDPGTTLAGEKLQVPLAGSPAQDSTTELGK
jgi:hypothetical protein